MKRVQFCSFLYTIQYLFSMYQRTYINKYYGESPIYVRSLCKNTSPKWGKKKRPNIQNRYQSHAVNPTLPYPQKNLYRNLKTVVC